MRKATSGVASFESASFDTRSFSELAWFFDAVTPGPGTDSGGGGSSYLARQWRRDRDRDRLELPPEQANDPLLEQLLREDEELIEIVLVCVTQGIIQ